MSEQPKCPHCHASKAHLHALIERLDTTAVLTVRCTLCGWRISRAPEAPKYENKVADFSSRAGEVAKAKAAARPTCSVIGCDSHPSKTDEWGMCSVHRKTMQQWQESRGRYACPFEEQEDGTYALLTRAQRRKHGLAS